MPIVQSTFKVGVPQANGKCYVEEFHTDHLGEVHYVEYGPVGVLDYQAIADARAVQIVERLAQQELEAIINAIP